MVALRRCLASPWHLAKGDANWSCAGCCRSQQLQMKALAEKLKTIKHGSKRSRASHPDPICCRPSAKCEVLWYGEQVEAVSYVLAPSSMCIGSQRALLMYVYMDSSDSMRIIAGCGTDMYIRRRDALPRLLLGRNQTAKLCEKRLFSPVSCEAKTGKFPLTLRRLSPFVPVPCHPIVAE